MSADREAQLLEEIAKRDELLARQADQIAALEAETRLLREKINLLVKRVFGSSSEQMNAAQLELEGLLAEGKADAPVLAASETTGAGSPSCEETPKARKAQRQRLPEHLPVEEEVIVPLEVQAAPESFRRIGEEVSERLDYRPARYLRLRTVDALRSMTIWWKTPFGLRPSAKRTGSSSVPKARVKTLPSSLPLSLNAAASDSTLRTTSPVL